MKAINLLRHGYAECAEQVARHIKAGRADYTVRVKPSGCVLLLTAKEARSARRECPAEWFVGNYTFAGLRTEHIEDDLLEREKELKAAEGAMVGPPVNRSVGVIPTRKVA